MTAPEPSENIRRHVSTAHLVRTLDGREIPLRYTELERDDGKVWACVEMWPGYPHDYGRAVFQYRLTP